MTAYSGPGGSGQVTSPNQIGAQVVQKSALNTTTPGEAVVTRIVAGAGIALTETGVDTGTGDVTITNTGGGGAVYVRDSSSDGSIVGAVNGVNTVFTLSATPGGDSLTVFINGIYQTYTTDYSLAVATVTFTTAPQNGDVIGATYIL